MIKRARESVGAAAFNALEIGRLTWIGLTVAAIGWALLLGSATVGEFIATKTGRPISATFHGDLIDIAKCVIGSGFGFAIIGALQSGFGTLNRFFGAVLARSNNRDTEVVRTSEPVMATPSPAAPAKRRPYRLFPDGSVEVETILGTRLFKTMAEAREFL